MKNVDVVIISWAKDGELRKVTEDGLDSLFNSDSLDISFHAYIVESNLDVNYETYNKKYWRHTCTTIRPDDKQFGYHKYLNQGRKLGKSEYVVLCNNDLTYEKNWASKIIDVMEKNPSIMSASPWCPQTQGDNSQFSGLHFNGYRVRGELAGWCIFQKRSLYEIIGDLDEQFTHWYCDNDYGTTLQHKGIIHSLVCDSVVNHHDKILGKTHEIFDQQYQIKTTVLQKEKFDKKWGF